MRLQIPNTTMLCIASKFISVLSAVIPLLFSAVLQEDIAEQKVHDCAE